MAMKTCPKCQEEINGSRALKEHMSDKHGGYSQSEIPSDSSNQAKEILGASSLMELAGKAPGDDAIADGSNASNTSVATSEPKVKIGRPKKGPTPEELEQQKRRQRALENIGGVICRKTATLPYTVWAKLTGNDSFLLNPEEKKELTDAYLEICRGYDANFTHPLMGVLAAMAINGELIAARLGIDLSETEQKEAK